MTTLDRRKLIKAAAGVGAATVGVGSIARSATRREAFQRSLLKVGKSLKSVPVRENEFTYVGMPAERVLAILGRPDEILKCSERDNDVFWRYGVDEPGAVPTLGQVLISADRKVRSVQGAWCELPRPLDLTEPEIRRVLNRLDAVSDGLWWQNPWNPASAIRALDVLWPLGRTGILGATAEYLRVGATYTPDGFGFPRSALWLLFQYLFDLSKPEDDVWWDPSLVVMVDGVPLTLSGFGGGGARPMLDLPQFQAYQRSGVLRQPPGPPPANPLTIADRVQRLPEWPKDPEQTRNLLKWVKDQLMLLVAPVFRPQQERDDRKHPKLSAANYERWNELVERFDGLNARWDVKRGSYVLPGGKTLPNDWPPPFHNWRWW